MTRDKLEDHDAVEDGDDMVDRALTIEDQLRDMVSHCRSCGTVVVSVEALEELLWDPDRFDTLRPALAGAW